MRILWHIIHGENRFSELKKALSGISEKVLYTSLRELEEAEILVREVEQEQKPSLSATIWRRIAEVKEMVPCCSQLCRKICQKE